MINLLGPFPILGMYGGFRQFNSNFKRILCGYVASDLELDFLPMGGHIQYFFYHFIQILMGHCVSKKWSP